VNELCSTFFMNYVLSATYKCYTFSMAKIKVVPKNTTQIPHLQNYWPHDRVTSFTDSIFAFSITILVLNLTTIAFPGNETIFSIIHQNLGIFITYGITFIVVARFWMSHVRLLALIENIDRFLIEFNLAFLFFITLFPFTSHILGTHVNNSQAVAMYALIFAILGTIQYLMGRHGFAKDLMVEDHGYSREFQKVFAIMSLATPIIFVLSIFVAFVSPVAAEVVWLFILFIRFSVRRYYHNAQVDEDVEVM
jgi:uncharacterized membrane protein